MDHVRHIERFIGAKIPRLKLEDFNYLYTALFNEDQIPAGGFEQRRADAHRLLLRRPAKALIRTQLPAG